MTKKQTYAVYLNIYDFTSANSCLKLFNLAAYHSDSNPLVTGVIAIQPQSAQYSFNRKMYLGDITLTEEQLQQIIDQLSIKYTCGKYHMFTNNCNHFSDQFAKKLVGSGLPSWLFSVTNCLKYFCCCLPHGFVSGLWAIQAIQKEDQSSSVKQDIPLLTMKK